MGDSNQPTMTPNARKTLTLKANGFQSKQIADQLDLDRRTVEYHLRNARIELGARNICHAIAIAMRDGLILAGEIAMVLLLSWSCLFSGGNFDARRGPSPPSISRTVRRESVI